MKSIKYAEGFTGHAPAHRTPRRPVAQPRRAALGGVATGGCGSNAGVAASYWLLAIGSCRLKVIGQRNCNENEDDDENFFL